MGTRAEAVQFQGMFNRVYTYTNALDVASAATGAGSTVTLAVPGVQLGDIVIGLSLAADLSGWLVTGSVTAADVVKVRFQNVSGGTLDPASATLRVVVGRPNGTVFQ